jgi:hypothetical protein
MNGRKGLMQEDFTGISTVIRMLADVEKKINLPRDDVRILEEKVVQLSEHIESHILYSERAVEKAEEAMCARLESMNEFRAQLTEQSKQFVTYDVYNSNHKILEVKIEGLQKIVWGGLAVVSFVSFAIPVLMHFF